MPRGDLLTGGRLMGPQSRLRSGCRVGAYIGRARNIKACNNRLVSIFRKVAATSISLAATSNPRLARSILPSMTLTAARGRRDADDVQQKRGGERSQLMPPDCMANLQRANTRVAMPLRLDLPQLFGQLLRAPARPGAHTGSSAAHFHPLLLSGGEKMVLTQP